MPHQLRPKFITDSTIHIPHLNININNNNNNNNNNSLHNAILREFTQFK